MDEDVYLTVYLEYLYECKSLPIPSCYFYQVCTVLKCDSLRIVPQEMYCFRFLFSGLLSVKTRISIYLITVSFSYSNSYGEEFILRFTITISHGFGILSFSNLNKRFGKV